MRASDCTAEDNQTLRDLLGSFQKRENVLIFEIGCYTGEGSTRVLGDWAKKYNGKVVTIDNFEGGADIYTSEDNVKDIALKNIAEYGLSDYVEIWVGNSDTLSSKVEDESIDFLFIDGGHKYTQVKKDIDAWYPKIKKGGIICGHDYESGNYFEEYIEEDYREGRHNGVIKAVNEKFGSGNQRGVIWIHRK